jgi:hypothetical protein
MNYKMLMLIPLAVPFVLALTHCGSEFSGVCNKQKQCTLGNSDDQQAAYDSCISGADEQEQVANDYSCGSAFSTYAQCLENSASCVSGTFMTGDCSAQEAAVTTCESAASALGHGSTSGGDTTSTGTGGSSCSACTSACESAGESASECATVCMSVCG